VTRTIAPAVLVMELTAQANNVLGVGIAVVVAYVIADYTCTPSIYSSQDISGIPHMPIDVPESMEKVTIEEIMDENPGAVKEEFTAAQVSQLLVKSDKLQTVIFPLVGHDYELLGEVEYRVLCNFVSESAKRRRMKRDSNLPSPLRSTCEFRATSSMLKEVVSSEGSDEFRNSRTSKSKSDAKEGQISTTHSMLREVAQPKRFSELTASEEEQKWDAFDHHKDEIVGEVNEFIDLLKRTGNEQSGQQAMYSGGLREAELPGAKQLRAQMERIKHNLEQAAAAALGNDEDDFTLGQFLAEEGQNRVLRHHLTVPHNAKVEMVGRLFEVLSPSRIYVVERGELVGTVDRKNIVMDGWERQKDVNARSRKGQCPVDGSL